MKVGVCFCRCGGIVADKIDGQILQQRLSAVPEVAYLSTIELACPVEGAVKFDDAPAIIERQVGAILLAVGNVLYDCRHIPQLGYGSVPGIVTSLEFERLAAGQGPTGGEIRLPDGRAPQRVAIVHCVGSLDARHKPYCSGICCMAAFKFNKLLAHKLPSARVSHYFRTLVMSGKDDHELYRQALARPETTMVS